MRVRLIVLMLLGSAAGVVPFAPAEAAAVCDGSAATIVGSPGGQVMGTSGPDVIVTNGATYVGAGAGDDKVCATNVPERTWVSAGEGDDLVISDSSDYGRFKVDLGPGSDRFVGGSGRDLVSTWDPEGAPNRDDDVSTGAGNDVVSVTRPIGPATFDADRVHLGSGDDVLALGDSGLAPDADVNGGGGRDRIIVNSDNEGTDVVIDAGVRTIVRDGIFLYGWASFEGYFVKEYGATVTFLGSSANEQVEVVASRFVATMRGGNDQMTLESNQRAELTGGPGRDEIVVSGGSPWIDLRQGKAGTNKPWASSHGVFIELAGVEDATAIGGAQPLVIGNGRDNNLVAGCGTVRGGGGADRLREHTPRRLRNPHPDACEDFVAVGGPGNDVLIGSAGPDTLLGGPGWDRAFGGLGRDRCVAEIKMSCER